MNVITIPVSAGINGFESPAQEYKDLSLSLDELLIEHPSSTYLCQAYGESMTGVGIYNNDLLIVDRSLTARHLDVVIANLNGELVCKLFDKNNRMLLSANDAMFPVAINEHDTFTIEGVLVSAIRCFRKSYLLGGTS